MQFVLFLPLHILAWLGIIESGTLRSWSGKMVARVLTGIASFVGFVSATVGLVVGWTEFVAIVKRLFAL